MAHVVCMEILDEILSDALQVHILEPCVQLKSVKKIQIKRVNKRIIEPPALVKGIHDTNERKYQNLDRYMSQLMMNDMNEGRQVKLWLQDAFFYSLKDEPMKKHIKSHIKSDVNNNGIEKEEMTIEEKQKKKEKYEE